MEPPHTYVPIQCGVRDKRFRSRSVDRGYQSAVHRTGSQPFPLGLWTLTHGCVLNDDALRHEVPEVRMGLRREVSILTSYPARPDPGRESAAGFELASRVQGSEIGIYLYWIPLGAGGSGFVRMNGRLYELIKARSEQRRTRDLYHTALEVRLPEGRFIVETMWPSPDGDTASRGVVMTAPVFARWMSVTRVFRYEVRCWQDGILPDADEAVGGGQVLSNKLETARSLLGLTASLPPLIWGRDQSAVGDMWNSNSVISWLLTRSGLPIETFQPPVGGRAPGWQAGIVIALRQEQTNNQGARSGVFW